MTKYSIDLEQNSEQRGPDRRKVLLGGVSVLALTGTVAPKSVLAQQPESSATAAAPSAGGKPNILVIFGDDIGYWNPSAYNRGVMGYRTPNIDRIAKEGAIFTDIYAQQSCTAGRAAFITGQSPFRTGLLKVGPPGAKEGLSEKDPTLAELLKPQGYAAVVRAIDSLLYLGRPTELGAFASVQQKIEEILGYAAVASAEAPGGPPPIEAMGRSGEAGPAAGSQPDSK